MQRKILGAGLLFLVTLFVGGCATILSGTSDDIRFDSDPPGALILIDGLERGRTPETLSIKRPGIGDTEVTLKLEGYEPRTFTLQKEFNAVSVLNLFGMVGWAVDVATGAVTRYSPRGYDLRLEPARASMDIKELQQDDSGRLIIPSVDTDNVTVIDSEAGVTLVFSK
jgi:hypothetical protein